MLFTPVFMCIHTFLDNSDILWVSYGSHLLTSIVKVVAFKAHLLLAAKNSLKDKEYFSNCLILLALLISWSALYYMINSPHGHSNIL